METFYYIFLFLAYTAAIGFFVFGVDDVFFDLQFIRYLRKQRRKKNISVEDLKNEPEQMIAIYIPAWSEGGVINRMAEYASKILIYNRYDIFIGVYPNDPETIRCVDQLVATCPRIHKAVTSSDGPTSKADCLNAIYAAMKAREVPGEREYSIIALHDAEDILHPLTLKVYNYFVPRTFDMGQIPVFPLELNPWRYWVGNTYMDEFAEWHMKDMYSREAMGGVVPSAGVGTAISRKAIEFLVSKHEGGGPFEVGNLAEDYMVGLEMCRGGFRAGFIDYPVERMVKPKSRKGRQAKARLVVEHVAVRENFPTRFAQAVRQKARWIVGTAFQGWERGGWWGNAAVRYTLVRDRRAPLVHCINAAGYSVIIYVAAEFVVLNSELRNTFFLRPIFTPDSVLWRLVLIDLALLVYRVSQKVSFVAEVYGFRHGLFAIPRYPVVNLVNMSATFRAAWLYFQHRFFNRPLAWTKTAHEFPGTAELQEFSRSIDDLLIDEGYVSRPDLQEILANNVDSSAPEALLRLRLIDEEQFTDIWSRFSGLPARIVTPEDVPSDGLDEWPESLAVKFRAMPAGRISDGPRAFVFSEPPDEKVVVEVEKIVGNTLHVSLARPGNIQSIRQQTYPRHAMGEQWRDPAWTLYLSLDARTARKVREFQITHRRSLSDSLTTLHILTVEEIRRHVAGNLHIEPVDLTRSEVDLSLVESLGPLFCEVHGIIPLTNGSIAIGDEPHRNTLHRLHKELGAKLPLCTDAPHVFFKVWRDFLNRRLSEDLLIKRLIARELITEEYATHVREMQVLISGPVDRLLVQLQTVTSRQVWDVLKNSGGLSSPLSGPRPSTGRTEGLLAPGFSERTGITAYCLDEDGICFRLHGIPDPADLVEVFERCTGAPCSFELERPNP
ncbi:MAG: glycosyltransferase [Terrimicrobiaceae bacterium]